MRGIDPWPALPGSDDRNAHHEVTVAMREDGYIDRRAQETILGCPAGAAYQAMALLVANLLNDRRPAPPAATRPTQQARDDAGRLIDAQNEEYAAAQAVDAARDAAVTSEQERFTLRHAFFKFRAIFGSRNGWLRLGGQPPFLDS